MFARLRAGEPLAALKRTFQGRFGITARQFNALATTIQGKIGSIKQRRPGLMRRLEQRIARARKDLTKSSRGTDTYHQKRRRLGILEQRLAVLRADETAGRVRLCFGSRKVFRRQHALAENGYTSHSDWLCAWRDARSDQFFVLGSKDETAGCQGCVARVEGDGTITLRLRLPNALATYGKHLVIRGLRFAYGHEAVVAAIGRNLFAEKTDRDAISWRFVRDHKGWRVCATVPVRAGKPLSVDNIGVVAIDLNADHLAVTDLDRFGNPVARFRVSCSDAGKSHEQALAVIGNAVAQVVTYACCRMTPLVIETLDFEAKKAELERRGTRYSAHVVRLRLRHVPRGPVSSDVRCGDYAASGESRVHLCHRCVHVRRSLRSLSASGCRPYDRAASHAARRAASPPTGRPRHLPATREESWEACVVVLAQGRAAGSGASSARTAGFHRSPILASTDFGFSAEHGLAGDPLVRYRCDSGT